MWEGVHLRGACSTSFVCLMVQVCKIPEVDCLRHVERGRPLRGANTAADDLPECMLPVAGTSEQRLAVRLHATQTPASEPTCLNSLGFFTVDRFPALRHM